MPRLSFIKSVSLLFFPIALVIILAAWWLSQFERDAIQNQLTTKAHETLYASVSTIKQNLHRVNRDVDYLANSLLLQNLLKNKNDPAALRAVAEDWVVFSRTSELYDQIRWLDHSGQERVRVNYDPTSPVIVPESELQNKAKRYYFSDVLKLSRGEVFISPFDLNIEHNQIEEPRKPTLRIGTPVFDESGQKQGILLLNYYGKMLLAPLKQLGDAKLWLANQDGYWLLGDKADDEWGFMYQKPELTIQYQHPQVWQQMRPKASGSVKIEDGLWLFETIRPLKEGADTRSVFAASQQIALTSDDYVWMLIYRISQADYDAAFAPSHQKYLSIVSFILILLFLGSLLIVYARQETQEIIHCLQDANHQLKDQAESLDLAASVFSHACEGIMLMDANSFIVDVNSEFTRITGYTKEEVIGKKPSILQSNRHPPFFYGEIKRALNNKGFWFGEMWNKRKTGEEFPEFLSISAVLDENNKINHYVAMFTDITLQHQQQKQLEHIAHHDALTGLPNRLLLATRLEEAITQTQLNHTLLAVLFIDLDYFKIINDQFGHKVGDQLLIMLSSRMHKRVREEDTISRIGGDEFVVVFTGLKRERDCQILLDRLIEDISHPIEIEGHFLQVSASIGVALYPQTEAVDGDQLIRQADQAMYQAKQLGKNRYHIFDAEKDRSIRGLHESLEEIREAIESNQFVLYYQPKVDLVTGDVKGFEALIRWQHPEKGLLSPVNFLPIIGQSPLAIKLSEWVILTALGQVVAWREQGLSLAVSVNLGAVELQQPDFYDWLMGLLNQYIDLPPSLLELEILETYVLADTGHVSNVIDACRRKGIRCSLDDFGTGYSSLSYLKNLPVDMLKIDQSFVRSMFNSHDDLSILGGIIGLAKSLNRKIIAEGIETEAQGKKLIELGCHLGQGYFIAKPMPAAAVTDWIKTWQYPASWRADH